jgi:hypothetical protein
VVRLLSAARIGCGSSVRWNTGGRPFQVFNPLRRIAAGQTAGLDFPFYHGIGVPFLHYPIFAIFGKTISASELSRQFRRSSVSPAHWGCSSGFPLGMSARRRSPPPR